MCAHNTLLWLLVALEVLKNFLMPHIMTFHKALSDAFSNIYQNKHMMKNDEVFPSEMFDAILSTKNCLSIYF